MNFKNITEVEEVSEIKETDKVILNVDGKAKQANANLIKSKEEHLYVKVNMELISSPEGTTSAKYTLVESNVKYKNLSERFASYDYIPVYLELTIQLEPQIAFSVRTYNIVIDAKNVPPMVEAGVDGFVLVYTDLMMLHISNRPISVLVKTDDTIEVTDQA